MQLVQILLPLNMSAEHEARRAGILNELQALAARIGTFQPGRETVELRRTRSEPARALYRRIKALIDYRAAEATEAENALCFFLLAIATFIVGLCCSGLL